MGESVRDGLDRSRPVPYSDGRSESTPYIEGKYPTRQGKAGVNTLGVLGAGTITGRDAGPYIQDLFRLFLEAWRRALTQGVQFHLLKKFCQMFRGFCQLICVWQNPFCHSANSLWGSAANTGHFDLGRPYPVGLAPRCTASAGTRPIGWYWADLLSNSEQPKMWIWKRYDVVTVIVFTSWFQSCSTHR